MTLDDLVAQENYAGNHGSFSELHGEDTAPGVQLVEEHLNKGFGFLFKDQKDAEAFLGKKCHPAPLGNISKPKAGGHKTKTHPEHEEKPGEQGVKSSRSGGPS